MHSIRSIKPHHKQIRAGTVSTLSSFAGHRVTSSKREVQVCIHKVRGSNGACIGICGGKVLSKGHAAPRLTSSEQVIRWLAGQKNRILSRSEGVGCGVRVR
jgi:hypothetical protein